MAAPARHPPVTVGTLLVATFGAAMIGLAIGAIWMLLSLRLFGVGETAWLALPVGATIGFVLRGTVLQAPAPAAVLAALTTLLAAAYMRCLLQAGLLAAAFGLGYGEALRRAGAGMLAQLAWMSLSPAALGWYLLGAAAAAAAAWFGWTRLFSGRRPAPSAR